MQSLAAESVDKPSDVTAYGYELRTLAEDVYLLTYRAVRKREGTAELHSLRSSIWTFIDGRWNAIPSGDANDSLNPHPLRSDREVRHAPIKNGRHHAWHGSSAPGKR